jgi:competence protein ComEC
MVCDHATNSTAPVYTPGLLVVIAVSCGIAVDRFFNLHWYAYLVMVVGAAFASILSRSNTPKRDVLTNDRGARLMVCVIMTGFAAVGALRHHVYWNWYPENEVGFRAALQPSPVAVRVTLLNEARQIAADPEGARSFSSAEVKICRALVRCDEIRDGNRWVKTSGLVWLRMPVVEPQLSAGDQVEVFGTLFRIEGPSNPGQYDFSRHYRRQRILASLHCFDDQAIKVLTPGGRHFISNLRTRLDRLAWRYLPPDQASLTSAILLGNREQVDVERRNKFLKTGTVHLLAISGLHVGILAGLLYCLFKAGWLGRTKCLLLTIVFVVFYAWLVEFRPPVVRATIFIVLFCLARLSGRTGQAFNILALAALMVLMLNPTDLFSLGAQLSFLAVAAITFGKDWIFASDADPLNQIVLATRSRSQRWWIALRRGFRAAFVVSALVWLIAIPLVACQFHVLSPIGLIVNPVVMLPISLALYSGLAIFVFGDVLPLMARAAVVLGTVSLAALESIVGAAGSFSGGHFWTSGPHWWAVLIFYLGWFVLGLYPTTRLSTRSLCVLGVCWLLLAWVLPRYAEHWWDHGSQSPMEVTFIDVGHGTCVLLELPEGENVLYDCGSTSSARFAVNTVSGVLWCKGINRIDTIVLSHADIDHYSGVEGISERFTVEKVVLSPMMMDSKSPSVIQLLESLTGEGVEIKTVTAGDVIDLGSVVQTKVLSPRKAGDHTNDNSASLVVAMECHGRTVLLPGDLEKEGMERLLRQSPIKCDLLMAAHHGSPNSDPARFLQWAAPKFVAVSCGDRKFSARAKELFAQSGCEVKRTDVGGAISFVVEHDGKMTCRSFLDVD